MPVYTSSRNDPSRFSAIYASRGIACRMGNGDGTPVTPINLLCASRKTVDLGASLKSVSILDVHKKAPIIVVQTTVPGTDSIMTRHIMDCSAVVDIHNVTPQEVISLLNTQCSPPLPNMVASYNNLPRAVNLVCTNPAVKQIQIFGYLAGALGFGGGKAFTSFGSFWFDFLTDDSTVTVTPTNVVSDATTAQLLGGFRNSLTEVVINGTRVGVDYAVAVKKMSPLFMQAVVGGTLVFLPDGESAEFEPISPQDKPTSRMEIYNPRDRHNVDGSTDIDVIEGVVIEHVLSGTIVPADDGRGAVSIDTNNFTVQARTYRDQYGLSRQQPITLFRGNADDELQALVSALQATPLISMLASVAATSFTVEPVMTLPVSSGPFENQANIVPPTAAGFTVDIAEPNSGALGCTFEWDDTNQRIRIRTSNVTGSETVTVTITNSDSTVLTQTFDLTVGP